MADDSLYIPKCLAIIEEKLGWGKASDWQQRDFEGLSEKIFEQTKVLLSPSTLKRIWGKTRYDSKPSMATLNSLAQFAGYENWRSFTAAGQQTGSTPRRSANTIYWLMGAGILATGIITSFSLYKKNPTRLHFEKLVFSVKPVTTGVPNTVLFYYDASHSNADSVFIQQSWDRRRRYKVDKALKEYSSTYYFPGYYRAKLILNDSIVKEQDVYIESQGWMAMIEQYPIPIYLSKNRFNQPGPMAITEKDLTGQQIDLQKELPLVSITKVDKGIDVASGQLSLTVQLRNTSTRPAGICRQSGITLMGTEGIIDIPLSEPGCVGEIGLMIGMKIISGKTADLSAFGVDFSRDVVVTCNTSKGMITISLNNTIAYRSTFAQGIGRIVGAKVRFKGTGVVQKFELKKAE